MSFLGTNTLKAIITDSVESTFVSPPFGPSVNSACAKCFINRIFLFFNESTQTQGEVKCVENIIYAENGGAII